MQKSVIPNKYTFIIPFITNGYDGFIDFIKAYAILCVLFGHSLLPLEKLGYCLYAGIQVPLFILVQVFHCYKKELIAFDIKKIFNRIFLPFIVVETCTVFLALSFNLYDYDTLLSILLTRGGFGNGSYYPWLYLQIALLLPLFAPLLKKLSKRTSFIAFLLICEGIEILCSYIGISDNLYRVLAIRYIFLLYLGWQWAKEGIIINWISMLLSFISLVSIIYFEYFSVNDEPWFFFTGWSYHRWPCYFYVAYGFTSILYYVWLKIKQTKLIFEGIKILAASSYEIFLVQMTVRFFFKRETIFFINNGKLAFFLWLTIFWGVSIGGGIIMHRLIKKCSS